MRRWLRWDVLSNMAYPLAAVAVAHNDGPTGWVFIAAMAFLASASAEYHTDTTRPAHYDVMAMYALGFYLFLYAILGSGWWPLIAVLLVAPAAYWLRMKQLDVPMERKIGPVFAAIYGVAFLFHGANQFLLASVGVMVVALVVRRYDHGAWHPLSAVGLSLLWAAL